MEEKVYYVGQDRKIKSLTGLFLKLADDDTEKTIYVDEGVYDIFNEYKELGVESPSDDVKAGDYFSYNIFLPLNTKLIGIGNVNLKFSPEPDDITYGESITWAPLNVLGKCHIENINIYCKNGRYCIHDDCHNKYQNVSHYYKNVRCVYEKGDIKDEKLLGFNNTIGFGFGQGCKFEFEDCSFEFLGEGNHSAFYGHEAGRENPENAPTILVKNCKIVANEDSDRAVRLQSLAVADLRVFTHFEACQIHGGLYLTILHDNSSQHFDVTLKYCGNPSLKIDKEEQNRYPVKMINDN